MDRNPAIILGGGDSNGLGVTRDLGRHGIPIYCLTSNPDELTCASKYCCGYQIVPDIESDPAILRQTLTRFATHLKTRAVLFPTTDTTLLTVSAIRDELRDYVTFIPPRDVVETMVIKSKFYQSLQEHGIPHPATYDPTEESVSSILAQVTFPVYVRPAQTLVFLQHFQGKGWVARTPHELRKHLHRAHRKHVSMLVQQIIPGPVTNGYGYKGYFTQTSQLLLLLAIQKLRQPIMFANCTLHKTIPRATLAAYESILFPYLSKLGYTGLFGIEFKRDPGDGQYKLLDVNARSCGDSALGPACGLEDNLTAYRDALGLDVPPQTSYTTDLYYIWEPEDLRSLWQLARRRQLTRHAVDPYVHRAKQFHILARDDLGPVVQILTRRLQRRR
jgi:predicted ATP-grasp superfamily ATP-dependent carboligase